LAPDIVTLRHIQEIDRSQYRQDDGDPIAAMIWSEPGDDEGKKRVIKKEIILFQKDWRLSNRGLGYCFPKKATKLFLHVNNLKMIFLPFQNERQVKQGAIYMGKVIA